MSVTGPLNHNEEALTVREVWNENGIWSLNSLSFELPTHVRNRILAVPASFHSNNQDMFIWGLTSDGKFSETLSKTVAALFAIWILKLMFMF